MTTCSRGFTLNDSLLCCLQHLHFVMYVLLINTMAYGHLNLTSCFKVHAAFSPAPCIDHVKKLLVVMFYLSAACVKI